MSGTRGVIAGVAALVAALAGGCTASAPPTPTAATATGSPAPSASGCDPRTARIQVGKATREERLTGATRLTIKRSGERWIEVVAEDRPVGTEIRGIPADGEWRYQVIRAVKARGLAVKEWLSPPLSDSDQFLTDFKGPGMYLGYAAVRQVTVPLTITCTDGSTMSGQLVTWDLPITGWLECSLTHPKSLRAQTKRLCRMP